VRLAAEAARKLLREGRDPVAIRQAQRAEKVAGRARTFRAIAEMVIKAEAPGWKNAKTTKTWRASLTAHAYPVLGDMHVAEIDRTAVMRAVSAG
jgi:hypothetical protein